jgi:hypothetical protein
VIDVGVGVVSKAGFLVTYDLTSGFQNEFPIVPDQFLNHFKEVHNSVEIDDLLVFIRKL